MKPRSALGKFAMFGKIDGSRLLTGWKEYGSLFRLYLKCYKTGVLAERL